MAVVCVGCDREIPAADVNLATGLAKCTVCNAVFGIMDQVSGGTTSRRERGVVDLPPKFTIDDAGGELRIDFRWFTPMVFALVFFLILWDSFLVVWYVIAFSSDTPLIMKLFPLLHVAVGVGLTWYVIATFLNRTTITVGDGALRVKHGPVPWPGNRNLYSDDVDQLYTTEAIRRNKNSVTYVYNVFAKMRDGAKVKLVSSLNEVEQALFIEQEIEKFLRIEDRAVPGEVPR